MSKQYNENMNVSEELDMLNKYIRQVVAENPITFDDELCSAKSIIINHLVNVGAKVREIKRFLDAKATESVST